MGERCVHIMGWVGVVVGVGVVAVVEVPWLPAVAPAPVEAAAGESLTASAPPPAVYGYTPEQRVGTERIDEID